MVGWCTACYGEILFDRAVYHVAGLYNVCSGGVLCGRW